MTPVDAVTTGYGAPGSVHDPYTSIFSSQETIPNPQPEGLLGGPGGVGAFEGAVESEWSPCGDCGEECCAGGGRWFGAIGALVMGRNRANPYWTTYETNNNANQLMNTQNAGANWTGGWAFTGGYLFGGGCCPTDCCSGAAGQMGALGAMGLGGVGGPGCCGVTGPGLMFSYWGLGQMTGFSQLNSPTNELSTPMNLQTQTGDVLIGGDPASDFFDNSASQRIWRNDRFNNIEFNFLFGAWNYGRVTVLPFAGLRYFRFDERLKYGGLASGAVWGQNGGADEAYLYIRSVNNMFGPQVGTYLNVQIIDGLGWFIGPKVGIFGNQMNTRTLLYRGDGVVAYDIPGHKIDFSMLAELDTGFDYFFRNGMFVYLGYRVVGVANVALSDNQFLPYLADTQGFHQVKQNGDLILHGVMMGGGWVF